MKALRFVLVLVVMMGLIAACAPATTVAPTVAPTKPPAPTTAPPTAAPTAAPTKPAATTVPPTAVPPTAVPKALFYGAFATLIEEPWDGVIHQALKKAADAGKITYQYQDNLGYKGDMERVLRQVATEKKPAAIFGDAFGNEEAVRRVAKDFPKIAFVFGSGGGPAEPNFAVFDNWIHEPAYLCGMLAGGLTKTGVVGVVGGLPVPEVNRIVNAFKAGMKEINPKAKLKVAFINSWYDPAKAKDAALAQIAIGADVLFAERFGVIEAAASKKLFAFGNMSDQNSLAKDYVISGPVWNMEPTVEYVIKQVMAGTFTGQDLKDFSMVAKGGASLAPFHGLEAKIPADLLKKVQEKEAQIKSGVFRVDIVEGTPTSD